MTRAEQENKIADLKAEAVIPLLEVYRDEIAMRVKDGSAAQELHGPKKKIANLVHEITKLLQAAVPKGPTIVIPPAAPGDGKDPSFYRAHSATNLTEAEREKRRREAEKPIEAEVVKETPKQ